MGNQRGDKEWGEKGESDERVIERGYPHQSTVEQSILWVDQKQKYRKKSARVQMRIVWRIQLTSSLQCLRQKGLSFRKAETPRQQSSAGQRSENANCCDHQTTTSTTTTTVEERLQRVAINNKRECVVTAALISTTAAAATGVKRERKTATEHFSLRQNRRKRGERTRRSRDKRRQARCRRLGRRRVCLHSNDQLTALASAVDGCCCCTGQLGDNCSPQQSPPPKR